MKEIHRLTAICLLLSCISLGVCRTTTAADKSSSNDYDYDYGDDDKVIDSVPTYASKPVEPVYFVNPEVVLSATPGDSIILGCDIRNFRNDVNTVMWYKGKTLISIGHDPVSNRYESMDNNSLRIKTVEAADSGDYYCTVMPEQKSQHISLKIEGLYIFCNGVDYTNRTMNTKQGESFTCECKSFLPGNVKLKWSINGERAENIVAKVDNGKLYADNIDSDHEGIYQCLGDDNSTKPAIGVIMVNVNYEPKVSTHRHHVNAEEGSKAELYCDYKANPIGITRWHKNGHELAFSGKYSIKNIPHHTRNRTILIIKNVNNGDLGEYECQVQNTIGSNEVKVYLIYEPETPQYEDMEINGNTVKLHWLVRSKQPLSEAVLDYKMSGAYTWSSVSVLQTKRHAEQDVVWKITHEMELMPGLWHARVKTRNTVGWSKFSAQHDFSIADVDDDNVEQPNNELPPQNVLAAGIGVERSNGGSKATPVVLPGIIAFIAATMLLVNNRGILRFANAIRF